MSDSPICTIITPSYNAADVIDRTIESVRAQTFVDWEYIIVDDGSVDGTADVIERYLHQEPRLRLVQQRNGGPGKARTAGLGVASPNARYMLFLDHDDLLEPEAVATMVRYLDERPDVGMVYCDWTCIDSDGRPLSDDPFALPRRTPARLGLRVLRDDEPETPFATLLACFRAFPSASLYRRSVFEQTDGWAERFSYNADKHLALQAALVTPVHYLPVPLMRYRRHHNQMSQHQAMWDDMRLVFDHWWGDPSLTPEQRITVRDAIMFDRYLRTWRDAGGLIERARDRDVRGLIRRAWHLSRKTAECLRVFGAWLPFRARARVARLLQPSKAASTVVDAAHA
jgi:glycosyltransferase involved in cell wall biosynthesis